MLSHPFGVLSRPALAVFLACSAACLSGCGSGGVRRVEVSGEVTLDGQPLDNASVLFSPTGKGPSAGGKIEAGTFRIERSRGPRPGPYRVEITAYRPTGQRVVADPSMPDEMVDVTKQIIPACYNQQSELEVELSADGENHLAFHLKAQ